MPGNLRRMFSAGLAVTRYSVRPRQGRNQRGEAVPGTESNKSLLVVSVNPLQRSVAVEGDGTLVEAA